MNLQICHKTRGRSLLSILILGIAFFGLLGCENSSESTSEGPAENASENGAESTAVQASASTSINPADTLFINGKILTVDDAFSTAESLAIEGDRIVAVGSNDELSGYTGDETEVIDLEGKTVMPGLIDNHFHFLRGAWSYPREARLDGVSTRAEALQIIAQKASESEPGEWVLTMGGFSEGQFLDAPGGFSKAELDEAAPDNPVWMQVSYRNAYVNSKALEVGELDSSIDGLRVRSNEGRALTQLFTGPGGRQADIEGVRSYMGHLNSVGLTAVYDVGRPTEGDVKPLADLAASTSLPLRVFYTLKYRANDPEQADEAMALISDNTPLSVDSQFGLLGLGEHIYGPVSDNPNRTEAWSEEEWQPFAEIAALAAKNGWPIHEHAMSNVTAVQFLDMVEEIAEEYPQVKDLRWILAHVNTTEPDQMARAAELGVALGIHSQGMMGNAQNAPKISDIVNSGALWGLGSDANVVAPVNPFITLGWVVSGENIGGAVNWPATLTREQALRGHTINNAYLLFAEDDIGSLEVGKFADLVVIEEDYMQMDAKDIRYINPVLVMTGGQIVH